MKLCNILVCIEKFSYPHTGIYIHEII
jgi:hypothetical protein